MASNSATSGSGASAQLRVVPRARVVGERAQCVRIAIGGRPLHGADANVARGDAGEHGAFAHRFPKDRFACHRHREAARRWDAKRVHRLADDVFPQHRAERRTAVAAAREPRLARSLQLDVDVFACGRDLFSKQNRAAVTKGGEVAELVTGVRLRDRSRTFRQGIASKDGGAFRPRECLGVQAEARGEWLVKGDEAWRGDASRRSLRVKERRQLCVRMLEAPACHTP